MACNCSGNSWTLYYWFVYTKLPSPLHDKKCPTTIVSPLLGFPGGVHWYTLIRKSLSCYARRKPTHKVSPGSEPESEGLDPAGPYFPATNTGKGKKLSSSVFYWVFKNILLECICSIRQFLIDISVLNLVAVPWNQEITSYSTCYRELNLIQIPK